MTLLRQWGNQVMITMKAEKEDDLPEYQEEAVPLLALQEAERPPRSPVVALVCLSVCMPLTMLRGST